ncbi:PNPLA domain-containing protein [Plasmodiophora brassicae]
MLRSGAGGRRGWVLRVKAIVMRVLAVNARFLMWIVAPDLLARVIARHSLALLMLYVVHFGCRKLRGLLRARFNWLWKFVTHRSAYAKQVADLKNAMRRATSFEAWHQAACDLDQLTGRLSWKDVDESDLYDHARIRDNLSTLRKYHEQHDIEPLMDFLRSHLSRNLGGIDNPMLYEYLRSGTKTLVEEYTYQVARSIDFVANDTTSGISVMRKLAFFTEARHAFGRSALLLSGGSTLGLYHAGVITALVNNGVLPRVISGSSVGSIFAAMVGTRTDAELAVLSRDYAPHLDVFPSSKSNVMRKLERFVHEGYFFDMDIMQACVTENVGDFTFWEAYVRTGRILNIAVTSSSECEGEPLLLNYLTAPNVLIWSAVCASCAIPYIFKPVELKCKQSDGKIARYFPKGVSFYDGSVHSDLPVRRLAEMFNVNHYIVSQVNPHVVPFVQPHLSLRSSSSWVAKATFFFGNELRDLLLRIASLVLSPRSFLTLESVVAQTYVGDVTLFPEPSCHQFTLLLDNPTHEHYLYCKNEGERYTWRKLAMIKQRCCVEFALDACVRSLRTSVLLKTGLPMFTGNVSPLETLNSRIRSWSAEQFEQFQETEKSSLTRGVSSSVLPELTRPDVRYLAPETTRPARGGEEPDHAPSTQEGERHAEHGPGSCTNIEALILAAELDNSDIAPLP